MKTLGNRPEPVASLYVKSLPPWGPLRGIRDIFQKARATAPCCLIFEDVDSLISADVRSYFLNEVDGLEDNAGLLMLGSTNHRKIILAHTTSARFPLSCICVGCFEKDGYQLTDRSAVEQLDPGIAKRPSRFDRKYLFPLPSLSERIQYCEYWRSKLSSNSEIDFPNSLCAPIAKITEDFSFAYMKEAFVAALLALVVRRKKRSGDDPVILSRVEQMCLMDGDGWEKLPLWIEIKKQINLLRKELDTGHPN